MGPDEHYREAVDYLHSAANEPHVRDDLAQLAWLHFRAAEVGLALEAAEPEWEERGLTDEPPRAQTVGTGKIMVGPAPNPFVRPPAIEWTDGFAQSWSKATEGIRRTVAGVTRAQNTATAAKLADPHGKNRCVAVHQAPGDKPGGVRCLLDEGHTGQHEAARDGELVRWGPSDRMTPERAAEEREETPAPRETLEAVASDGKARCRAYHPTMTGLRCDIPEGHPCDHESWLPDGAERIAW